MKKTLLFACVMACAVFASAQVTIIPKAGVALSEVAFSDNEGVKPKIGLNLGLAVNMIVSEIFSIQPELQFIQKGYAFKESETFFEGEIEIKGRSNINYLELPILLRASFGSEKLRFFFNAGPSVGFGIGGKGKFKYKFTTQGINESIDQEYKVKFGDATESNEDVTYFDNRMDIGIQLGGGILIAGKVMIEVRYGLGMTNLVDERSDLSEGDAKSKNRVLQFTVGVPLTMN